MRAWLEVACRGLARSAIRLAGYFRGTWLPTASAPLAVNPLKARTARLGQSVFCPPSLSWGVGGGGMKAEAKYPGSTRLPQQPAGVHKSYIVLSTYLHM